MGNEYIPPSSTQLPFTFTTGGYTAPSGDLLFEFAAKTSSFSNLNAAIQVMQLYHDEAYTYVKSCPKHVIGYSGGIVQIIKGPCVFGGIRDLRAFIIGLDISSDAKDLSGFIKGVGNDVSDLSAGISMHLPENIRGIIKPIHRVVIDFPGSIYGWQKLDLYANILMHPPKDLEASIFVKRRLDTDLNASIHAWHIKDLQARVDRVFPFDLSATLLTIQPVDLPAYLKTRYAIDLNSSLKGWGVKDLSAYIDIIFANDLNAEIYGRDDMFGDLRFRIKGRAIEVQRFLAASVSGVVGKDLNAILVPVYMSNLPGYVFPVLPKDISATIYAWHAFDLRATLNGQRALWDLLASIVPNNNLRLLGATICSKLGTRVPLNLPARIHSFRINYLTSSIGVIAAGNLQATLIPFGYSSNISASIYPKMIRLTAMIKVATMEHRDLSAMINCFCVYTGYVNLSAYIYTMHKSDLFAYIKALKYSYKPNTLSASTGYADTITEVDKYKISFTVVVSSMRTFDRYMIGFNIFGAVKYLSAYIKGIMQSVSLGASIVAKEVRTFNIGKIQQVEHVVHLSYAGIFNTYEVVEMAFKSLVSDYYYSTDGDYAWKMNRLDRWILDIKSYLPKNEDLRLKRRLHRGTELYDLKRFSSIDEAMRHAIAYVTEYPQSNLGGSIYGIGSYVSLGAIISPVYTKPGVSYLSGMLTPVVPTIIVGIDQDGIEKI